VTVYDDIKDNHTLSFKSVRAIALQLCLVGLEDLEEHFLEIWAEQQLVILHF
jgi:hypothetical protein